MANDLTFYAVFLGFFTGQVIFLIRSWRKGWNPNLWHILMLFSILWQSTILFDNIFPMIFYEPTLFKYRLSIDVEYAMIGLVWLSFELKNRPREQHSKLWLIFLVATLIPYSMASQIEFPLTTSSIEVITSTYIVASLFSIAFLMKTFYMVRERFYQGRSVVVFQRERKGVTSSITEDGRLVFGSISLATLFYTTPTIVAFVTLLGIVPRETYNAIYEPLDRLYLLSMAVFFVALTKNPFPYDLQKSAQKGKGRHPSRQSVNTLITEVLNASGYKVTPQLDSVLEAGNLLLRFFAENKRFPDRLELFEMGASLQDIPESVRLFNLELKFPPKMSDPAVVGLLELEQRGTTLLRRIGHVPELQDFVGTMNMLEAKIVLAAWSRWGQLSSWPKWLRSEVKKTVDLDTLMADILRVQYELGMEVLEPLKLVSRMEHSFFSVVYALGHLTDYLSKKTDFSGLLPDEVREYEDKSRILLKLERGGELTDVYDTGEVISKLGLKRLSEAQKLIQFYIEKVKAEDYSLVTPVIGQANIQSDTLTLEVRRGTSTSLQDEIDRLMQQFEEKEHRREGKI